MKTLKRLNEVVRERVNQSISALQDRVEHLANKHDMLTDKGLSLSAYEVEELKQKQEELARQRRLQQTLGTKK